MLELKHGLVQVYTGNGKGKTTAALGQAMRSTGRGLTVYMVQFLKSSDTGELHMVKKLYPEFQVFRFEKPRGFFWTLDQEEKQELKGEINNAFEFCRKVMSNSECDVLILDEIMGVLQNGLLTVSEVLELINQKPQNMELILTGRDAPLEIVNAADLVTEMREIKHYFSKGVPQRKGIEY